MAESFYNKGPQSDAAGMAVNMANGGPPPSTLAAQLVENISVSNKSSRSDENTELRRLFATIERVKDDPELLKTASERIEHNHMLIYVYSRVVLDNLKLDSPFVQRDHVRSEALKAINFLRFTVKETPAVLLYSADNHGLLYRGEEPLWIWLLPHLLKLLGHAECLDIEGAMEGFLQYLWLLVSRNTVLWELASSLSLYLRSILSEITHRLQDPSLLAGPQDIPIAIELPPSRTLERIIGGNETGRFQRTTYTVPSTSQALRQALSLARVLSYPFTSQDPSIACIVSLSENGPWLMDTWLHLRHVQKRLDLTSQCSAIALITITLDIVKATALNDETAGPLREKACTLLVLLCNEMVSTPGDLVSDDSNGEAARLTYCMAIIAISQASLRARSVGRLAMSKLVEELGLLTSGNPAVGPDTDTWRCTLLLSQIIDATPGQAFDASTHPSKFADQQISRAVEELGLPYEPSQKANSLPKRQKTSHTDHEHQLSICRILCDSLLGEQDRDVDISTVELFLDAFNNAPEETQCQSINVLSLLPCMDLINQRTRPASQPAAIRCPVCHHEVSNKNIVAMDSAGDISSIFAKIIRLPSFIEARRSRVAAMIALRRIALHSDDPEFLDLETSEPGQWCLQSLNSSVRELRIAAGRTLAAFIRRPTKGSLGDLSYRNRTNSIALLRSVSDKGQNHRAETCIMAWGQIGRVVDDEELNLVLIKLLEYLGSSNTIQSAFAHNELLNLAEARNTTPRRLFEPFWRNLAYMVTKDLVHRPQRTRAIADLLQVTINELLLLIQTHALPWLVLDRKKDVIQKIADARQETEIQTLMDGPNIAAILALLLMQEAENVEAFTKSRLDEISSHFHPHKLVDLIQGERVQIALELLKASGDAGGARQNQTRKALHTMALMLVGPSKESKHKKGNLVGRFLHAHILGLIAPLTDVINDSIPVDSLVIEQRRCVRALEEMIKLCKDYARIARPQISAVLLSVLPRDELRGVAISCWSAMLTSFEEDDVEALLETTFFIVSHYWSSMDAKSVRLTTEMLNFLLEKRQEIIRKHITKLPSLPRSDTLDKFNQTLAKMRPDLAIEAALRIFAERIGHENSGVVHQALNELVPYLKHNQRALHVSAVSQRPDTVIATLLRALLDCASRHNGVQFDIPQLCAQSMGLVGCLDFNQIEMVREQRYLVIKDNFESASEVSDFVLFVLEEVLVPSFLSATDPRLQGFLCFVMQELLDRSGIKDAWSAQNVGQVDGAEIYRKWIALPEQTREVVTPFFTSKYVVAPMAPVPVEYPIFRPGKPFGGWLRSFAIDLLRKGQNPHADLIFEPLTRVIRVKDLSTAEFLLPYLVLHILLGSRSSDEEKEEVVNELIAILGEQLSEDVSYMEKEDMKRYCHAVFKILDYAMRWIHTKRSSGRLSGHEKAKVAHIQGILDNIPAELIAQRALDCNEYARALFHLEQHARKLEEQKTEREDRTQLLERLQNIYANIDEPDGLEGISANLPVLDINQQILSHKKAGRWAKAQTWCEMQLAEKPDNLDVQLDLLNCLKQAGQHDVLLNHVGGMRTDVSGDNKIMPYAVEAAWVTGRWETLSRFTNRFPGDKLDDFNISLAALFDGLRGAKNPSSLLEMIQEMRGKIASSMNHSTTVSLQAAHEALLKCHALTDLEIILEAKTTDDDERRKTMGLLEGRLAVIGAQFSDKQYLLGIQRAMMELNRPNFSDLDISCLWLSSARLARKSNSLHQSFNAVLHASRLGDDAATIENAKLLWRDEQHRKAIQMLQGAIERNKFMTQTGPSASTSSTQLNGQQKLLTARAQLLLAKWLDNAGQTHASALREKYQQPPKTFSSWEKGHYYLGRHYKKILESEKPLKVDDQSDNYITGEIARLVIENYVRSLNSGTKYLYQTLPRILTLWLDLGANIDKAPEGKASLSREVRKRRVEQLNLLHAFLDKYIARLPAYIFYTALPQIVARITHPNKDVLERLTRIIVKVVEAHPRQALWSIIGIITQDKMTERKARGAQILVALRNVPSNRHVEDKTLDLKVLIRAGEKLAEQLLRACMNGDFHGNKTVHASLTRDLHFSHKCAPCPLVVPVESSLMVTLPAVSEYVKKHKAFSQDVVTIDSFLDDVLVLSSMAKPRRLTSRGTDGKLYMLLVKPKDDLRTDQRLMEFNGMINRSLKKDAECSRRQLYIRTYAVVPLNEECGIIEWVPGIRTMRDILLNLYSSRKIYPDYQKLRQLMAEAAGSESKIGIFTRDVLGFFPPVLQVWFIQQFPNPSAWFAARLRYTRSCAVMSMVGTILGLGDRHGENLNLEEGNGGVFHVDFNCLFDKGQTLATPERVPFRLTHNMVAAMGIYGYEGPFRKTSELTLSILRQQEETLMSILEAFIYDPTLDLQRGKNSSKRGDAGVKLNPQSVVESIKRKVKGLLPNESIPLGVEGQVEELIKQAIDPRNLTAMYIGWCPFL